MRRRPVSDTAGFAVPETGLLLISLEGAIARGAKRSQPAQPF